MGNQKLMHTRENTAKQNLVTDIADHLRERIRDRHEQVFPTVTQLCAEYRTSRPTMLAALHQLCDEGIMHCRRGQRIQIAGLPILQTAATRPVAAFYAFALRLEQEISKATYRSGQILPKIRFLASSNNLSDRTVVAALRLLASQGRVYKRGKSWVVGQPPRTELNVLVRGPATILLLQAQPLDWLGLASGERTAPFSQGFTMEAQNHGVQIIPVLADELAAPRGTIVAGQTEIEQLIRQLGERYIGALIVRKDEFFPAVESFIEMLLSYQKPAVYFDPYASADPARFDSRLYTRCHFCERSALKLALEFLADMGHRTVAYLNNNDYEKGAWSHRRGDLLKQIAGENPTHSMRIITREPRVSWWNQLDNAALRNLLQRQHSSGMPNVRLAIDTILREQPFGTGLTFSETYGALAEALGESGKNLKDLQQHLRIITYAPVVIPFLQNQSITAFIAPRDHDAMAYYFWLRSAGLALPRDYSLISFDNYLQLSLYPVTTVDFGFGYLGYAAFHSILGDIQIKRDRNGDVPSQPALIRRGSVGPPRRDGLPSGLKGDLRWI